MNKQTFNILREILVSKEQTLTIEKLSEIMNVSQRMIYNYCNDISFYCSQIGLNDFISFNDGYVVVKQDADKIDYLSRSVEAMGFDEYRLNTDERKNIIIILLASSYEPIRTDYFQESLFISKNTINADIKNVKEYFEKAKVVFDKNKRNGLLLCCDELKRIEIIIDIIYNMDAIEEFYLNSPVNPAVSYLMNYLKVNKYRYIVGKIIKETEDETNCKLTDYYYFKLIFIISIILSRTEAGFILKTSSVTHKSKDIFIDVLIEKMKDQLNICVDGINFFNYILSKYRIKIQPDDKIDNPKYINTIIQEFLFNLNEYYKVNLNKDGVLLDYLNAHILACYHRILSNESIDNPYLQQIHDKYTKDFQVIKDNIYVIENGLNIPLNDGEIAYILLHILTALERCSKQVLPTIALICGSGVATSNFVAEQIKKHFKCNIIILNAIHDLEQLDNQTNVDLIVSTIPLQKQDTDVLVVNAVLQEKDFGNIYRSLDKYKIQINPEFQYENNDSKGYEVVKSLFDISRIELDVEVSDWKDAIIKVGEKLLWEEMITPNYIHHMINLVLKNGPYMVIAPHIALVHASPNDGVKRPGVSIVRLKEPVNFGKEEFDPIQVIVCCAIEDSPQYINALMKVMSIIKHPHFIKKVMSAKCPQEIIELFYN